MGVSLTSSRSFYVECHAISLKNSMEMSLTLLRSFYGDVIRKMPSTSLETSIMFNIHKDLPMGCHPFRYGVANGCHPVP